MDDVHDVLTGERLEVELVSRGIVGGDGLRIVVDDDGLEAELPDRPHGMDRGVVKLDALPNANGAGAEDDDLFAVHNDGFVFRSVGRIEVRNIAVELTGAGVDHFINRENAFTAAQLIDFVLCPVPELSNVGIREAHALGLAQMGH